MNLSKMELPELDSPEENEYYADLPGTLSRDDITAWFRSSGGPHERYAGFLTLYGVSPSRYAAQTRIVRFIHAFNALLAVQYQWKETTWWLLGGESR